MTNREKLLNKLNSYNNKELAFFMYFHEISTCDEKDTNDWGLDDYVQWLSQEAEEDKAIHKKIEELKNETTK